VISKLMVDGYHAWGDLYDTVVGRMEIELEENGITSKLSVGQTINSWQQTNGFETRCL